MKYLIKRDDFLRSVKSAESDGDFIRKGRISGIAAMNEAVSGPFENDLGWGDSLLGRLINAGIRKAKIDYSAKRIDSCLKDLKTVLDSMIAGSVKEEIFDDMNLVRLKKYFTDIEAICISADAEEEKLDKLIGGHEDLWDEKKKWDEQLDGGLLVETCEFIDKEVSEETCKKFIAAKTKVDIIKELGVFIDNLRKMTSEKEAQAQAETEEEEKVDGFLANFKNTVKALSVLKESILFDFSEFIVERSSEEMKKLLRDNIANRERQLKDIKDADTKKQAENELEVVKRKLKDIEGEKKAAEETSSTATETGLATINKTAGKADPGKELGTGKTGEEGLVTVGKEMAHDGKKTALPMASTTADGKKSLPTQKKPMQLSGESIIARIRAMAQKCKTGEFKKSEEILKDKDCVSLIKALAGIKADDLQYIKSKNSEAKVKIDDRDLAIDGAVSTIVKSEKVEDLVKESAYSIFENSDYEEDVLRHWESFKVRLGLKESDYKITKEEHDKLDGNLQKSLEDKNSGMVYDVSKNADPIIAIARIYKRAHDLYYTPVIPSGRSGGRVSNKTFREYEKLGSGSVGRPEEPGYGPWASRKVRQKWTDGVMEILQDQKYRKILANIKFIVPGSEDTFNKESLHSALKNAYMILEAEGKKSHGLILFDFMNDLLSDEVAANFDKQRQVLMQKYFGSEGEKAEKAASNKQEGIKAPGKNPGKEDIDAKTMVWQPANGFGKDDSGLYAIPIEKKNLGGDMDHYMIFMHRLKKEKIDGKEYEIVKFTFDNQAIMNKIKEAKYRDYSIANWSTVKNVKNVYYGALEKFPKGKFKIAAISTESEETYGWDFNTIYESSKKIKNTDGIEVNVLSAKMTIYDKDKNKVNFPGGSIELKDSVLGEDDNHNTLIKFKDKFEKCVIDTFKK